MRGRTIRLKGTVWQRPNGRWSVLTPEMYDPKVGRNRRIALGTFDSEEKAEEARRTWVHKGGGAPPTAELPTRPLTVATYLRNWLANDIADEVACGHLAWSTGRDYEQVVKNQHPPVPAHRRRIE